MPEVTSWRSGPLTDRVRCVLAPNPGVMTLEGTNTWLLREPGSAEVAVVDPGPDDAGHIRAVLDAAAADGGRITQIVLTHHHRDHTEAVPGLVHATGAPVRGGDHDAFDDGERVRAGDLEIEVVRTPGHTGDSVSFLVPADKLLLTGDTVLGRGTTVITAHTGDARGGDLGDYLRTLDLLVELIDSGRVERIAPGHGPALDNPGPVLRRLREHRRGRLDEVRAAVEAGAEDVDQVVDAVYGPGANDRRWAAAQSVRAQLDYLGVSFG